MRGFPVNGDPKPAELSRPPENPPPELGYRCAQGRRLDLVDNCFWHLGDIGALASVRFASFPEVTAQHRQVRFAAILHCTQPPGPVNPARTEM